MRQDGCFSVVLAMVPVLTGWGMVRRGQLRRLMKSRDYYLDEWPLRGANKRLVRRLSSPCTVTSSILVLK